jgi:hypothetical protein
LKKKNNTAAVDRQSVGQEEAGWTFIFVFGTIGKGTKFRVLLPVTTG